MAQQITLALDWTPNTNHIGFYVAAGKGWYQNAGLEVSLLSPEDDNYQTTPAAK
uniref:ABC transporter substrate-binding protein n=1 Tax=Chloroflexus sp. TaxID=1904827 RepID=UPI002ACDBF57